MIVQRPLARTRAAWIPATLALSTAAFAVPLCAQTMRVEIDATDLPRKLLSSTVTLSIPKAARADDGTVALWYPKWVPGVHAPGGPVQNIGGMVFETTDGTTLEWQREPGEPHLVHVAANGASEIVARMRYIADQPSTNSTGIDVFGSKDIGYVSANTIIMVPDGESIQETLVDATLLLPDDWTYATALRTIEGEDDAPIAFQRVTLETFIDSPILCGRYAKTYDLVEDVVSDQSPPQRLHIISESKQVLDIDETLLARFRRMATEATRLFESHPFDHYELLLATTDVMPKNGLEHLTSSFNVLGLRTLADVDDLKGWDRYLMPHEYVHAWCGKYRRPAGMLTPDFHTPKDTRLLWVYEGLTQYIGKLIEVRSGLASQEDLAWYVREQVRDAMYTQGREWRPTDDTAAAAYVLRGWSHSWGYLRRGQDFYHEGAMFWLEADARIRNLTDGERSLDDFARIFFARDADDPVPNPYTRADVVATLDAVASADWDTFIHERLEQTAERYDLELLSEIGYRVQYANEPPDPPEKPSGSQSVDAFESLGMSVSSSGTVHHVILDSPADRTGLGPGMKLMGVDGYTWSTGRLTDAIEETVRTGGIDLLVESGDRYETLRIDYDGGPRHLVLVRDEEKPDRLAEIGAPLDARPVPAEEDDG